MPCSFGLLNDQRSGVCAHFIESRRLTVTVRWIPLVTAAYGALRHEAWWGVPPTVR
jgi:hypothetical protein